MYVTGTCDKMSREVVSRAEGRDRMIAIIDYDAGNLKSVEKALVSLGEKPIITRSREEILASDKVILP